MKALLMLLFASPLMAAPKIDNLVVRPGALTPDVEIGVSVAKSGGNCDARIEFGDGKGRNLEFGLATTRTLKYSYAKGGSYKVVVKGAGKTPCDGAREVTVAVKGPAEKKAAEKKAEKKKADKKSASTKKKEER
jgi:hypothetical protein